MTDQHWLVEDPDDCLDADSHTPHPQNYVAHSDWADEMLKTHRQKRCPSCGHWELWVPKPKREKHV